MSTSTTKIQSVIESAFVSAIDRLATDGSGNLVSDLYLQVDFETGELQIYDDAENLLGKVVIFDWVNRRDNSEKLFKQVSQTLRNVLNLLSTKGAFDESRFMRPFSVSLTDDAFSVTEELLFLDDELFRLDDPLLKDLDADLDNFLTQLLSDME